MYDDILVFPTDKSTDIYKKKNNCWLIEFVAMKQIPDISEIIAEKE